MICGGIYYNGHTELELTNGKSLTSDTYITDSLENHIVPCCTIIGDNFVFMHENSLSHSVVTDDLEDINITTLNWSARSLDLDPI